ncbi:hypothetical protein MKX01_041262 [Papaver californicum]|nr:hypothetical protein MKX01_041262 [Papaver californicum]
MYVIKVVLIFINSLSKCIFIFNSFVFIRITMGFSNSTIAVEPLIILTPNNESNIKTALNYSVKNNLQIRVRSGGYDYEVQDGGTLGEVYYRIAEKTKTLRFPTGTCPTVGVGGHFSGGGIGVLVKKYGLDADNILDARLLDVNGRILDRSLMGENLFWAIRRGSGASFGIILSWKIKLVSVPPIVSTFTPSKSLRYEIADKFYEDLYVRVVIQKGFDQTTGEKTVYALFNSLYLGGVKELLNLVGKSFPESTPLEVLLNKNHTDINYFKVKSDFVQTPISKIGLQGLWTRVLQKDIVYTIMDPLEGMMSNISEFEIPFPHRKGNLYNIQYIVQLSKQEGIQTSQKHLDWIRNLYEYMTPYVSNSPRDAYLTYRDLDLGKNDPFNINYTLSSQLGMKYYKGNFKRLALVKKQTDPQNLLTPKNEAYIKKAFICSKKNGIQVRVKSRGHDYEGLSSNNIYHSARIILNLSSSTSNFPFIIVDLVNFRSINVNVKYETAWVQAGSTIGELYYRIAEKSKTLAFPAGTCPTVGAGGYFSGGGMGTLLRKYGVAADNVIDAYILDTNGRILNRKSMGENLFWPIRGGSGASFGIILSWKIKLVSVPPTVTVFTPSRSLEKGAAQLVLRWQHIADKLHEDLYIRVVLQNGLDEQTGNKTIYALFNSLYLGGTQELLQLMKQRFPELGVAASECTEMSWIESVLYFGNVQQKPLEVLLDRTHSDTAFFKAKSDFVNKPISEIGLQGIWRRFQEEDVVYLIMDPSGGIMSKIPECCIAFRNLYNIQYIVKWKEEGFLASQKHMKWMNNLYEYMTPFVTNSPRAAYVNYRDLDLGTNDLSNMSYSQSSQWGMKYFKGNFKRLALVERN